MKKRIRQSYLVLACAALVAFANPEYEKALALTPDVAAYISTLEISVANGQGSGKALALGKRRNANAEMVELIQQFEDHEIEAVLDYSSRLLPAEEFRAPADWKNPDFN